MKVLVTGSAGFLGRNLRVALERIEGVETLEFDQQHSLDELPALLEQADFVAHLAGSNRPVEEKEFNEVNRDLTAYLCDMLISLGRAVPVLFSSSIQAELDNPYGISKRGGEEALRRYAGQSGAAVYVYRLPNLFGKWSRPNYNSVVSTFCHNIAHGLPIEVRDPAYTVQLAYVDHVVAAFLDVIQSRPQAQEFHFVEPVFHVTLGELAEHVRSYENIRHSLQIPDMEDPFNRALYPTYLSYLPRDGFSYEPLLRTDNRGWLFELLKAPGMGQIFVSTTKPGITRGNHYHDSKLEKFCVIAGEAVIRFRHIEEEREVIEYAVQGSRPMVVDIPPGYTHSIENTGDSEMICLFWASEVFDPDRPDTWFTPVMRSDS